MILIILTIVFPIFISIGGGRVFAQQPVLSLESGFKNPPISARPRAYLDFNNIYGNRFEICKIDVFIDDEYKGEYVYKDMHHQKRLFVIEDLALKEHTLKVVCKDEHAFIDYARFKKD
jgi:hypothetical protein